MNTQHDIAVVVASGGFQADTDWLTRARGEPAKNFLIQGTPDYRATVLWLQPSHRRDLFLFGAEG